MQRPSFLYPASAQPVVCNLDSWVVLPLVTLVIPIDLGDAIRVMLRQMSASGLSSGELSERILSSICCKTVMEREEDRRKRQYTSLLLRRSSIVDSP